MNRPCDSRAPSAGALRLLAAALAAVAALAPAAAHALINPRYTPADLVRDSGLVLVLRASAPRDGRVTAEVVEALVGTPPSHKALVFDFADAEDLAEDRVAGAFGGAKTALAVMCVQKKKQDGAAVGALEIGTTWMGLVQGDEKGLWKLDRDPNDLETVWGGSARQLVPAIRYVLADRAAAFPVASTLTWGRDLALGKLPGASSGCLVTADGVIVLSEGGDRVFRPGEGGGAPTDVTAKLGLTSRSKAMAVGDFNGDGRPDLASWDGERVRLALRGADGTFGPTTAGPALAAGCRSLSALGDGLVAGMRDGLALFLADGGGGFAARRLEGPGGVCAVADFNDDGAPDIMAASAEALAFHAGGREPGTFAPPVVTQVATVKDPAAVVCGDYDTDGLLDLLVAGDGGAVLLSRLDGRWTSIMAETGELVAASGLGRGEGTVVAACPSDLNGDGRQAVALFQAAAGPGLFFNRGFACFGVARSLEFSDRPCPATEALGGGQMTGTLADLSGDLVPDLLAADRRGHLWVIFGAAEEPRRFHLTAETAGRDPLTVSVFLGDRRLGIWVVRPGQPAAIALPAAGKVTLRWRAPDGTPQGRDVVVTDPTRVKLLR
jgi:hypothetical protein